MRERIICESINSLRQEGLRFSVDILAEKLNISKKTVYKYFPNKEVLAIALFERYYDDIVKEANQLIKENTKLSHTRLLELYFDAKSMTRKDIFNKYKLNDSLYSFTKVQNENFWRIILSSMNQDITRKEELSFQVIVDGSFEKLCNEKIDPSGVIERLVNILW